MPRYGLVLLFACVVSHSAAQTCPKQDTTGPYVESVTQTFTGTVIYHNEIRQWLELRLDRPACGQTHVQLLDGGGSFEVDEGNARSYERLRGCHATVVGELGIPSTDYYSAELYLNIRKISAEPACPLKPLLPDYSKMKPQGGLRSYRVAMAIDYAPRGGGVSAVITAKRRAFRPWQAYASYWLTGGYVFYGRCAEGYRVGLVTGTVQSHPGHSDEEGDLSDMAMLDPESGAVAGVRRQKLVYTCRK